MKVGFVGVGAMGGPMAGHVLKSGKFDVYVHDIRLSAAHRVAKKGAKVAKSLKAMGRSCDVIIVMVTTDTQVKQVVTDLTRQGR